MFLDLGGEVSTHTLVEFLDHPTLMTRGGRAICAHSFDERKIRSHPVLNRDGRCHQVAARLLEDNVSSNRG